VQTETFIIFLGNKIKIFSAVLIFRSRSVVVLTMSVGGASRRLSPSVRLSSFAIKCPEDKKKCCVTV